MFHMTAVPFGRGASPLQNLISRGFERTPLSAIRMIEAVDAGPVCLTRDLALSGTAEEVYLRADSIASQMIADIVKTPPVPKPQIGEPVVFTRRRGSESTVPADLPSLSAMHDFIRMLDADTYPRASVNYGRFCIEFTRSSRYDGRGVADATITELESGS